MDPNQARSIRVAKRLEGQLNLNERDKFDYNDDNRDEKAILRDVEKQYKRENKEIGKEEINKEDYFGCRIEPFHMKEERETGKINEDLFVEHSKKKEKEARDPWLDSLEEVEDPRFKAKRRVVKEVPGDAEEVVRPLDEKELFHLKKELYDLLQAGEDANHALTRLKPSQAKPQARHQKNVRKKVKTDAVSEKDKEENKNAEHKKGEANGGETKNEETQPAADSEEGKKKAFDRIVEICSLLCGNGYMSIYSDTKEEILKKFMLEEDVLIKHDLEDEGKIEDMNPDHNVVEQ